MELGAFSMSLSVADMAKSLAFYTELGFEPIPDAGDGEHWQMLRNGTTTIGLFHGMFEGNILTFNPGWDAENQAVDDYIDVRTIRDHLAQAGVEIVQDTTADSPAGPASFVISDPDGNTILVDQHI